MATSIEFIEYVCEQVSGIGIVRYRKMFGEYMVYINDKPILLVCDNTVFVKELECIKELMNVKASSIGDTFPLKRAVKGRCGDFRSKAKKILPDLDCGSLSV